jgi:hypothetical protein
MVVIAAVRLFSLLQICKCLLLQAIDVQSDTLTMNAMVVMVILSAGVFYRDLRSLTLP